MYTERIRATEALDRIRRGTSDLNMKVIKYQEVTMCLAREQVWLNPGFHEQLVLFELCQYNPTPSDGIYKNWRSKIERQIREGRVSSLN